MSPSFSTTYAPPGAYVKFLRENLNPNLIAGYRVPTFIGSGVEEKTVKTSLVRGSTTKDTFTVPGVSAIVSVGDTDAVENYVEGIDYALGSGADAGKIIWTTPGTSVVGSFEINDLDLGSLSGGLSATRTSNLVDDGYVVEVTVAGAGNTKGHYAATGAMAATLSVTETITITVAGVAHTVALASGDTRAQALAKIVAALTGVATVTSPTNLLTIATTIQGATATIAVTVSSSTLKQELGIHNGTIDTFTYTAGTSGTGQVSITARSDRSTTLVSAGENTITAIPGLSLVVLTTASNTVGERAEILTYADVTARNPLVGATYYVTVTAEKQLADYELKFFTREEEEVVYQIYGEPSPTNSISLAAYVAFRNLVDIISVVQVQGAESLATFSAAIDKCLDKPIYYVIPLTSDPQVQGYVKLHVDQQSETLQRRERIAILGGGAGYDLFDHIDSARSLNDERICWVAPSSWEITYLDTDNVTHVDNVDGVYGAVAVASIAAQKDPATPLTRKQVVGLKPLVSYNPAQQNTLASNGIMVIETFGSVSRIRHQLTTYANGPIESKELSIVQLRDHVSVILRNNLEDEFPGTKILRATPKLMEAYVEKVLEGLVQQEIIVDFKDVKVVQNDVDPTELDVYCSLSPVYPLNYALVTFKFMKRAQITTF